MLLRRSRLLTVIAALVVVIGLLFAGPVGADSRSHHTGTVYAYVYSDAGMTQPVEGVQVWLTEGGSTDHFACTDATGKATFEGVAAGVELKSATGAADNRSLGCPNADFRAAGMKMFWMAYDGHSQGEGGFDNWDGFDVPGGGTKTITYVPVIPAGEAQNEVCASRQISIHHPAPATNGDDIIMGTPGNDTIRGLGGNDVICGGSGNDKLIGQAGDDFLSGWSGTDLLIGKIGDDTLFDNDGTGNVLKGGPGVDLLIGSDGDDTLIGGRDKDWLHGYGGADEITGAHGNDMIYAGGGDDTVYGKFGYDKVWGGNGNDDVFGGDGNDKLWGESGDDTLRGANGDDTLDGGTGGETIGDTLKGGTGGETIGDVCTNGAIVKTCNP